MHWGKKLALLSLLFVFALLIGVCFELISSKIIKDQRNKQLAIFAFYKKYSAELNHLREFDFLNRLPPDERNNQNNYMFTEIGTGSTEILIQGDSWAEQFLTSSLSSERLRQFAGEKYKLIVAGTTSYSPSPMSAQLHKLLVDFGFRPKYLIAVIDQTDIGDELCRYRSLRGKNGRGEIIVRPNGPRDATSEVYNLNDYFERVAILTSSGFDSYKIARLAIRRLKSLIPREPIRCGWGEIAAPLYGTISHDDREYFIEVVNDYIDAIFASKSIEKVLFVTHFHRLHHSGEYKLNVVELLNEAIIRSKYRPQIHLLDFAATDAFVPINLDTVFVVKDNASHLTDEYHGNVYTARIIRMVNSVLLLSP